MLKTKAVAHTQPMMILALVGVLHLRERRGILTARKRSTVTAVVTSELLAEHD